MYLRRKLDGLHQAAGTAMRDPRMSEDASGVITIAIPTYDVRQHSVPLFDLRDRKQTVELPEAVQSLVAGEVDHRGMQLLGKEGLYFSEEGKWINSFPPVDVYPQDIELRDAIVLRVADPDSGDYSPESEATPESFKGFEVGYGGRTVHMLVDLKEAMCMVLPQELLYTSGEFLC
jgi:hypothetical protein